MLKHQNFKKALVIDDNKINTLLIEGMLQPFDLEIFTAHDGTGALDLLTENQSIDIIYLDLYLPDKDGFEVITHIRNLEAYQKTPIIAISGRVEEDIRERCLQASFNEYLPKPIDYGLFTKVFQSL